MYGSDHCEGEQWSASSDTLVLVRVCVRGHVPCGCGVRQLRCVTWVLCQSGTHQLQVRGSSGSPVVALCLLYDISRRG
jgi:hypothetical protein